MMKKSRKMKLWAGIGFIAFACLLALFLFIDKDNIEILKVVFSQDLEGEAVHDQLMKFGIRGYITITLLAMLQVVVAVMPAEPIQVLSGVAFGFLPGIILCTIGVVLGNTIIYILYKIYGEKLADYFDKKFHLNVDNENTLTKLTIVVFVLYFLPAIPYGMICFFAATMGLKYPRYIFVTTLGAIPSVCIGVGLGHVAVVSSWVLSVVVFGVLIALLALAMWKKEYLMGILNRFLNKKKAAPKEEQTDEE